MLSSVDKDEKKYNYVIIFYAFKNCFECISTT